MGEVGMVRTSDSIFLGQRLIQYRTDPCKLDNRFLLYAFQESDLQGQIKSFGSGATVAHMRVPDCEKLTLRVPPLPTQRKIAAILSAYDDLIENNTRRIAILEEMARSLYREWFVHFRFPGHQNVPMVESEIGVVPSGWPVVPFSELADVLSGGTPKTSIAHHWNGSIPFFTPRDAPASFYAIDTEKHITEEGLRNCNSRLYPKDTVFITARGTVGKVALAASDMAMNQSCYALRGKARVTQEFLFFATLDFVRHLKQRATGATFDAIVVDTFRSARTIRPPDALISAFTVQAHSVLSLVRVLIIRNDKLRFTRDLLLPKLISGEVDVASLDITVPEDET
jgi:type I restriction enzyme, S subunit